MPAEPILLGPFAGGLNQASDPTAVQDNDLVIMENFELDLDRALKSRPPIREIASPLPTGNGLQILGYYYRANQEYLIVSDLDTRTYYFDGSAWVLITNSLAAAAMVQYKDKAWLVANPNTAQVGGSWDPVSGFAVVSAMPRGGCATVSKERIFIGGGKDATINGSRLTYCAPGAPTSWPASTPAGGGFIEISGGDGQDIVEVANYYNDILIFKEHSTYRFSYSSSPDGGQVTPLDSTVGCADAGCVIKYRSSFYVLYGETLYELTNSNFSPLNTKVPFTNSQPAGVDAKMSLGAWDSRVFVSFFDVTYVYSVDTQTWATWKSTLNTAIGDVRAPNVPNEEEPYAYMSSRLTGSKKLYRVERQASLISEPIVCRLRTKNYDYQLAHAWKRLMRWDADLIAPSDVEAVVSPVGLTSSYTWADMIYPWSSPLYTSWARGLNQSIDVTDTLTIESSYGARKYIKFPKSLRFRQIYFELALHTDGTALDGPAKVFTLTTWVAVKQSVAKKIN